MDTNDNTVYIKTQTCKQEYASAGKVLLNEHILNFFESCVETDQPTNGSTGPIYLSLDASLPKHNKDTDNNTAYIITGIHIITMYISKQGNR